MKSKIINIIHGIVLMLMLGISNVALAADIPDSLMDAYWVDRYQAMLICNSKSGGSISEVKITAVQEYPSKEGVWKVSGTYRQANPVAITLSRLGTNQFAELTGIFQAFVTKTKIFSAKYKVSVLKGRIKEACLNSNAGDFDF